MAVPAILTTNEQVFRFLHVLSGIVWIGMLYFFNLVNLPLLKFQLKKPYEANMAEKATGHITIKTLFWFRWGALFTVLLGILLAWATSDEMASMPMMRKYALTLGMLLGIIMAINVWFVIWPRQKKILANNKKIGAEGTTQEEKDALAKTNAPLVKTATLASRFNTWASVAMLWGMIFGAHGYGAGNSTFGEWRFPIVILLAIYILMWAYSTSPKKKATA